MKMCKQIFLKILPEEFPKGLKDAFVKNQLVEKLVSDFSEHQKRKRLSLLKKKEKLTSNLNKNKKLGFQFVKYK